MSLPYSRSSDFVSSHMQEAIKTYSVFDINNRLIEFYSAIEQAKNGDTCAVTYYAYDGATSRVLKSRETLSTWNSTWDI